MKSTISFLICLLLLHSNVSLSAPQLSSPPLEKVSLQLKWFHQFQFAGYYAAKELGFYAAEGLDVDIFERSKEKDAVMQVVSGERDFAIGDSGILSYYARGEPIVALAAIFQHNPLVFVSKQSSGIVSPYEMSGKKIMLDLVGAGDSPLRAVLADANLTEKNYTAVTHSFNNEDLINDKIDVMSAYLSDQPFYFQQQKIKINIINPQNYGIDFYGDLLFTSQHELAQHQGRAEKFRRASLKGWQYALDHPEELIQLIQEKYHSQLSIEHLRFEAEVTRKLILPDLIPLGQIDAERMRKVAEVYAQLNISKSLSETKLAQFVNPFSYNDNKPLIVGSEQDYPPFAIGKTDETIDGFTVELWRAVAEAAHLNAKIKVLPFHQLLNEFKSEKIDVLINLAQSDERHQFADFTVPHVWMMKGALFVRDDNDTIHSETDLTNKKLIIINGDLAQEYAQAKGWGKQLILVDTAEEGLRLLASGQHDAMLLNKIVGTQTVEKSNIRHIKIVEVDIDFFQKYSFAVHKGDAELLAKINEGLAIIKTNGTYDKLYEKWFGIYEEKELLPLVIQYLAPIVIVFLLSLLVIFYRHHLEHKRDAKILRKSEARFRNTFEFAPIGVMNIALNGDFLAVNQTFCHLLSYSREELLTMTFTEVTVDGKRYSYSHLIQPLLLREASSVCLEKQFFCRDGEVVWGNLSILLSRHADGSPDYLIATVESIDIRKHIENQMLVSKDQLQATLDAIPDVLFELNFEGRYVNYHAPRTELLAMPPEYFLGKTDAEILPLDAAAIIASALQEAQHQGWSTSKEFRLQLPSQAVHWFELSVSRKETDDPQKPHFIVLSRDVTERKQVEIALQTHEQQLKETESRLTTIFNKTKIHLWAFDGKVFTYCNQQWFDFTGQNPNVTLGINDWIATVHPDDLKATYAFWCKHWQVKTEHDDYFRLRRHDGIYRDFLCHAVPIFDEHGVFQYFQGFNLDITELKQTEEQLKHEKQIADLANKAKGDFLANMSHEIRTPMNGIIGLTQLVLDTQLSEQQRDYLTKVFDSSRLLLGILNEILDFSKIEAGQLTIECIEFDLTALLENIKTLFSSYAVEKELAFNLDIEADTPRHTQGDPLRLQQVLNNLVSNALKFTEKGSVTLRVRTLSHDEDKVKLLFSVQDTGMGMNKDYVNKQFEPFSQADNSITRRFGGTGLGLAISQKLLKLMDANSKFHIISELGVGTTFSFELLLTTVTTASQDESGCPTIDKQRPLSLAGLHLLIAEDNPVNQMVIRGLLKRLDISVDMANNGREALQLLEQNSYDGVLMDMQMPVMGGMEATKLIRGQERFSELPIIALTAGVTRQERDSCQQCGMNDFVAKPVDFDKLVAVLCLWLLK